MITKQDLTSVPDTYRNNVREDIAFYLPKTQKRVIEIGCGTGVFSTVLNEGAEYWGVEPEINSFKIACELNKKGKFFNGFFSEIENEIPNNYFDVVICNDVIEHIPDYLGFLESIKGKMEKDAVLIASVPNVRYIFNLYELLVKKDWEYKDFGILDRTHYRFFTKKSIIRTFDAAGFEIEILDGLNSCFSSLSIWKKILKLSLAVPMLLTGFDSQFLQFAVKVKLKK